ncbi:hypothetical protein DYBT9275_01906 [Dyadobacter sp. CECT 9275]|uniref:Leucine-binding protein domain-containing protein n=1 Tax=Dyadobacter helix TaxID=2822344 RepID=A0A916N3W1_9BACT|nr:ABC transporter substrate-binding protein [Dyadobacter sp. CECT 9275]CAG4998017.1 hypothetical protein DYBT9275_01906 [Dyadobacter sp. CECT 9275]
MRFSFVIIVVAAVFSGSVVLAQKKDHYNSIYNGAITDYKAGRYPAVMTKLAPLTNLSAASVYSEYAHYYYALAAYHSKRYKESRQMLLQLLGRYPDWNKRNEVYYLLGADHLASGLWKEGFQYFDKVKDTSFLKDIQGMKQYYLSDVKDLATLINIQKQFPEDRDVAMEVVQFIEKSPASTKTDFFYAEQLQKKFKITTAEKDEDTGKDKNKPRRDSQWEKGYFNVSVLLPFRLEEFNTSKRRTNQFAYDYYLGLLQAREVLKGEGVTVNLSVYDISTDEKLMKSIVENPAFQESDLVIGPLYAPTFDITAKYVSNASMIMLNPLSTDGSLTKAGPNVYLAHPSINSQVQKAARWMKSAGPSFAAAIYYGNTSKDSSMAFAYANEVRQHGGKVLNMAKITGERESMETNIPAFDTQKPSHVALFSSVPGAGTNLISTLNGRKLTNIPVLATANSFNLRQSQPGKLGARLYLIETDYIDREKDKVREFQKAFWNANNTFPSVYSYQGYDQLLFFGRMLSKYKDQFARGIQSRKYDSEMEDDYLLGGFDYTTSRENQISPLLKYNGSKWVQIK